MMTLFLGILVIGSNYTPRSKLLHFWMVAIAIPRILQTANE